MTGRSHQRQPNSWPNSLMEETDPPKHSTSLLLLLIPMNLFCNRSSFGKIPAHLLLLLVTTSSSILFEANESKWIYYGEFWGKVLCMKDWRYILDFFLIFVFTVFTIINSKKCLGRYLKIKTILYTSPNNHFLIFEDEILEANNAAPLTKCSWSTSSLSSSVMK